MLDTVSPQQAAHLLEAGAVLIDVREPDEFLAAHIPGATLQPLSVLHALPLDGDQGKTAVYYCQSGNRTAANAALLAARGYARACIIEGGLAAWQAAGLPVTGTKGPLPLMRQVHVAAGGLVLLFVLLGQSMPIFRLFAGLVGAGLVFSGLTGFCGMALVLMRMPWNKTK